MYWYKVKNLLIVLFAVINLFLIGFIINGHFTRRAEFENRQNALNKALTANNIMVDKSLFSYETKTVKTTTAENIIPRSQNLPEIFLGGEYETIVENDIVKYVSGECTVYTDKGKLYYTDKSLKSDHKLLPSATEDAIKLLSGFGIDTSSATPSVVGDTIMFVYKFDDMSLFENSLSVKMSGNKISEINGYVININNEKVSQVQIRSVADILIDFIQDIRRPDKNITIKSVTLGYSILLADSSVDFKNTEIIPTYKITTDKNTSYFYDARE